MATTYGHKTYGDGVYGDVSSTYYGIVARPITFIKAVAGVIKTGPIHYYGSLTLNLTFKKAVSGIGSAIELPPVVPLRSFDIVWDNLGERFSQSGIDRGVLYLSDGIAVPWNGLIGIEDSSASELKSYYLEGVKYLENLTPGDFVGKLKAYTYPNEFESVSGVVEASPGLSYHEQPPKSFSLSYRTKLNNDILGDDYGYKIHILYNVIANPDTFGFETLSDSGLQAVEFGWTLTGTPQQIKKFRPTVHISIDSTKIPSELLQIIENILYGSDTTDASVPSIQAMSEIFGNLGSLVIIDYGDGTWSAIDMTELGSYITMLDDTTFQITNADAVLINAVTYTISSTN